MKQIGFGLSLKTFKIVNTLGLLAVSSMLQKTQSPPKTKSVFGVHRSPPTSIAMKSDRYAGASP